MPDKWAQYAQPASDDKWAKYASQAQTQTAVQPAQQGFFGSALDSSGLSAMAHAVAHPIDTISAIPGAIKQGTQDSLADIQQGITDYKKEGLSQTTRRDFGRAVPIAGNILATAQGQHDAGNNSGMAGTIAGTLAGMALPEVAATGLKGAGAIAKLAATSPESLALKATRTLVPGDAGDVLTRALKPSVSYGSNPQALLNDTVKPIIASTGKINSIADYARGADQARDAANAEYQTIKLPHINASIDTLPVAQAGVDSIPATDRFENPDIIKKTVLKMKPYDSVNPLGEVDDIRMDTNAKLNAFYNKAGGDQNAALSNPETARIKAVNDGTRNLVYQELAARSGVPETEIREMQNTYGKLSQVGDIANRREVIAARHDPISLAEKVVTGGHGPIADVWNFGLQKLLRGVTDSDALVRSAVDRTLNPTGTPLVPGTSLPQQSLFAVGSGLTSAGRGVAASPLAPAASLFFAPKKK